MRHLLAIVMLLSASCSCEPGTPSCDGRPCTEPRGGGDPSTGGGAGGASVGDAGGESGGGDAGAGGATGGGSASGAGGGAGAGGATGGGSAGSAGGGAADPCSGVVCDMPPARSCHDAQTLRTYDPSGMCELGQCRYSPRFQTCASGCSGNACLGDPCAGVVCSTPPSSTCVDSLTLKRFNSVGTCSGGACSYSAALMTCPHGCAAGACLQDPCSGVNCVLPPAAFCVDASTARSFSSPGSCAGGGCTYAVRDTTCPFGCVGGVCRADPCAGVACTTPPANTCVNATTARIYNSVGSCGATGACSYAPVDVACSNGCSGGACNGPVCGSGQCNQPPAATCVNATQLRTYARLGRCQSAACSYQPIDTVCSMGCFNGACVAGSWKRERAPTTALASPQLVMDASGAPHIYGCAGGNIEHRWRDDYGWQTESVDVGVVSGTQCFVTMAVAPNGDLVATWFDAFNQDLRFGRRVNGAWQKELVKNSGAVGAGATLAIDPSGSPVLAARDGTGAAVFRKAGNSWVAEQVLQSLVGDVLSLAYSPDGTAHLAAGIGPAYLAIQSPTGWSISNLGATSAIAQTGALGFEQTGALHLSYKYGPTGGWVVRAGAGSNAVESLNGGGGFLRTTANRQLRSIGYTVFQLRNGTWQRLSQQPFGGAGHLIGAAAHASETGLAYLLDDLSVLFGPEGACSSSCGTATCGENECGGSCGQCGAGLQCSSVGTCTPWLIRALPGHPRNIQGLDRSQSGVTHLLTSSDAYNRTEHRALGANGPGPVSTVLSPVGYGMTFDWDARPVVVNMPSNNDLRLWTLTDGGWQSSPGGGSFANSSWSPVVARRGTHVEAFHAYQYRVAGEFIDRHAVVQLTSHSDGGYGGDLLFSTYTKSYDAVATAATGDVGHLAWISRDRNNGAQWVLNHATFTDAGWSTPVVVTTGSTQQARPLRVRSDLSGRVHAFVGLQWATWENGTWTLASLPANATHDFALTPQGSPVLVSAPLTADTPPSLIARTAAGQWVTEALPIGGSTPSTVWSISIAPDGTQTLVLWDFGIMKVLTR